MVSTVTTCGVTPSAPADTPPRNCRPSASLTTVSWGTIPAAGSETGVGEHPVQPGVPLVEPDLHAAAQPGVADLEAVAQRECFQAGPAVTEVGEGERLQGDAVGLVVVGEGLHDAA